VRLRLTPVEVHACHVIAVRRERESRRFSEPRAGAEDERPRLALIGHAAAPSGDGRGQLRPVTRPAESSSGSRALDLRIIESMSTRLTLLTVHAHPDDETISTGGVMARYAAEGARVVCVTSTGGEHGEIVVPELDTPENHAKLAELRAVELRRALERLHPAIESYQLGYVDSGMMDTPENQAPEAFWNADLDEAAGRLVRIVRETRPHVLVGYNDFGGYGHPDHIRAAQVAKLAWARAGDPSCYPEHLAEGIPAWQPQKLYESAFDAGARQREELQAVLKERGIEAWWLPPTDETDEQRAEREAFMAQMVDAVGPITTRVDVTGVLDRKLEAAGEHVTQLKKDGFFLGLTVEHWKRFFPTENFTLRESLVGVRIPEDDLFAGLR
jgi:LmbE family N-acetylglucosaminyl deacetylase